MPSNRTYIGIQTEIIERRFATQRQPMWCWAACIQMIFELHGVGVSQEMIVHRSFGFDMWGQLPNKPGGFQHMTESLNHFGIDYHGRSYMAMAALYPGPPPSNVLLRELQENRPLLFSYQSRPTMNHAVLCTAAGVVYRDGQPHIETLVVRDPWPNEKNRKTNGRVEHRAISLIAKTTAHWLVRIAR
jgi:hypothetical protein